MGHRHQNSKTLPGVMMLMMNDDASLHYDGDGDGEHSGRIGMTLVIDGDGDVVVMWW